MYRLLFRFDTRSIGRGFAVLVLVASALASTTATAAADEDASTRAAVEGAIPTLVTPSWLRSRIGRPGLVIVDLQPSKDFQRFHIPGAVNAPYERWRTRSTKSDPGSMLPSMERMESLIGGLGIGNDSEVLLVTAGRGAGDLAAAARVFWSLKALGHDAVGVLDGGLVAYANAGGRLAQGPSRPTPTEFHAAPREDWLVDAETAQQAFAAGSIPVDARTEGEFVGLYTGDQRERPGTIPSSRHLPYDWVADDGAARLRGPGALRALFEARDIDPNAPQVHFCHSGNRAALTWFAAYAVLGNEAARLYDGSMMEWARRDDLPVEAEIELCDAC